MTNPLVGKTVTALQITEDKLAIRFILSDGSHIEAKCDADCCSCTWIEHISLPAPSDPQPRGAEPQVWLYDFMDGATTVRNWSTTNKAEAFAPGNFNQRGYVPAEN